MADFSFIKPIVQPLVGPFNQVYGFTTDFLVARNPSCNWNELNFDIKAFVYNGISISIITVVVLRTLRILSQSQTWVIVAVFFLLRNITEETMEIRRSPKLVSAAGSSLMTTAIKTGTQWLQGIHAGWNENLLSFSGFVIFKSTHHDIGRLVEIFGKSDKTLTLEKSRHVLEALSRLRFEDRYMIAISSDNISLESYGLWWIIARFCNRIALAQLRFEPFWNRDLEPLPLLMTHVVQFHPERELVKDAIEGLRRFQLRAPKKDLIEKAIASLQSCLT